VCAEVSSKRSRVHVLEERKVPNPMSFPSRWNRFAAATLAPLTVGLAACGGGGSSDVDGMPPSGPSATESRAVALSVTSAPSGALALDEAFAVSLVKALQARWTPAVRDAAQAYSTFPFVQGPFRALSWNPVPPESAPAEYGLVLASGPQVAARVYRCVAFDAKYAGSPSAVFVHVPALDGLTPSQRSALTLEQFTAKLSSGLQANTAAVRVALQRPGMVTVGDSSVMEMAQCDSRKHGTGLPAEGELSVSTGRLVTTLLAVPSADDQVVASAHSLSTVLPDFQVISQTGTFFGHFSKGSLLSLVRDDVLVFNSTGAPLSRANPIVQKADLLVPLPGAMATGAVPAPTLRVKYVDWKVNLTTGIAIEGTVTLTDSASNSATIKPVGVAYEVKIKAGNQERTYTVAP